MTNPTPARAGGRPSKYDPAFCDAVIEFMQDGYSVTAFAGSIGVSRQTIYNWMDENPAFFDAVKQGMAASAVWWEGQLRNVAVTGAGNATAVIFGLKNRVSDEWRDKSTTELTGKDEGPIQFEEKPSDKMKGRLDAIASRTTGSTAEG